MKKLLSLCLLLLTTIAGWAQTEFTEGNFKYTVTDEVNHYVSIAKADEATFTSALVIPSSVTYEAVTYAVTSVGASGFYETGITSITIPSSVFRVIHCVRSHFLPRGHIIQCLVLPVSCFQNLADLRYSAVKVLQIINKD